GAIARYKKLLDSNNIKLTVLLTPHNHNMLDGIDIDDYELFIRQLANITGFYNFMFYNKLTEDDCNYYETSHYRPHVGSLIVQVISGKSSQPSETFQYVSTSTMTSHVKFLRSNFLRVRGTIQ
ncbi:MAG: hypothetical protein NTV43_09600, partial [Methylococcales bacterium]|nr:hypothetical protein [Methylococcales bacterium]